LGLDHLVDRRVVADAQPQCERGDVQFGPVVLHNAQETLGDVVRGDGANAAGHLGAGGGEHARVADEAGLDEGDADAGVVEVDTQAVGEAAQAELGGGVIRSAPNRARGAADAPDRSTTSIS
jgi:hypothetical protein